MALPVNKPSQPLIPPTDVEEVEEIATNAAEAAIAADDTHAPLVDDKVPAANLPSYVDDVLNFDSAEDFPEEGEEGKIYVANDTNLTYRWSGVAYIQVGGASLAAGDGIEIENDIVSVDMDYVDENLDHVTEAELAEGLATKQPVGDYATSAELGVVDTKVEAKADKPLDEVIYASDNSDPQTILEGIDKEVFYKICAGAANASYTCHDNFGNKFTFKTLELGRDTMEGASAIVLCEHNTKAWDEEEYTILDHPVVKCYKAYIESDSETGDGRVVVEFINDGSYDYVANLPFTRDAETGDVYVNYPVATGLYQLVNDEDTSDLRSFGWFMCCGTNGWMAGYLDFNAEVGDTPRFFSGPGMQPGDRCYLASNACATIQELNTKQDNISDLDTIRSGAAAGASAKETTDMLTNDGDSTCYYIKHNLFHQLSTADKAVLRQVYHDFYVNKHPRLYCVADYQLNFSLATSHECFLSYSSNVLFVVVPYWAVWGANQYALEYKCWRVEAGTVTACTPETIQPMLRYDTAGGYGAAFQWDTTPVQNSTKAVTSGGVYTALQAKANASDVYTKAEVDAAIAAAISASLASGGAIDAAIQAAIGNVLNEDF